MNKKSIKKLIKLLSNKVAIINFLALFYTFHFLSDFGGNTVLKRCRLSMLKFEKKIINGLMRGVLL